MNNLKLVRLAPAALAFSLIIAGAPAVSAETAAPQNAHAANVTEKHVDLVDGRVLAIGLGVLGGVMVYNMLTGGGWGWGAARAARFAGAGMPGVAALRVSSGMWASRCISTASGVAGALVGDWIYRSNHVTE